MLFWRCACKNPSTAQALHCAKHHVDKWKTPIQRVRNYVLDQKNQWTKQMKSLLFCESTLPLGPVTAAWRMPTGNLPTQQQSGSAFLMWLLHWPRVWAAYVRLTVTKFCWVTRTWFEDRGCGVVAVCAKEPISMRSEHEQVPSSQLCSVFA